MQLENAEQPDQRGAGVDVPEDVLPVDTGLVSLCLIARYHDLAPNEAQLAHSFCSDGPMTTIEIVQAARSLYLSARIVRQSVKRLNNVPTPAIFETRQGSFAVLAKVADKKVLIFDPATGASSEITEEDFSGLYAGRMVFIASKASLIGSLARFDFTWFVPVLIKYRSQWFELLVVSFALQILGLLTPLFFQTVTDKVLVNAALNTLNVITIGLLVAYIFESLLSGLRTYVFSHTANRIDVELGAKLFRHLLKLPVNYFMVRRTGDTVARVQELEGIREFLTGQSITVVIDIAFSLVFFIVMYNYSPALTLIVVLSLPAYVLIAVVVTPIIRSRLQESFRRGAENQAFLIESVSSIETIKASAVEPRWQRRWDELLAAYVYANFRTQNAGLWAQTLTTLVSKITSVAIIWAGSHLVIGQELTIGQLIAFNMFSQHVINPILRLSQLWNDFQQVGVSMERLGDVLNTPTEQQAQGTDIGELKGSIIFKDIVFRYGEHGRNALDGVNFSVAAGEVIGIVGRSGSGKSTMTKLVQRLQVPNSGSILIDDCDLSIIEPSSLRRQIGVVLQENRLFNRTIRENISLSKPSATIEEVIAAAKLAGAHEFITEFPEGYATLVAEDGHSLSGGQRQRIAIARALLVNPAILIFDEATSALDYESEHAIQKNMESICAGRTVLIVAHRLTAVRNANRIFVFDKGRIVEQGGFEELAERPDGVFAGLLKIQRDGR
jgi:subfamily B ATP-binding cassette protein HlyB/CyaB